MDDSCAGSRDVRLVNGKIYTLDASNLIVSSVTIQNGKIASVGNNGDPSGGPCMQVINLGGRTVIPGLVDNHNHFLLLGLRPGHDTTARNRGLDRRRPGRDPRARQNRESWRLDHCYGRLDACAVRRKPVADARRIGCRCSSNPVLVYNSFTGPAATNTLGKSFLPARASWSVDTSTVISPRVGPRSPP